MSDYSFEFPPLIENAEEFFDDFVRLVKGKRVQEVIGRNPDFLNADYQIEDHKILAEL